MITFQFILSIPCIWYRTIQPNVYKFPWIDQEILNKPSLTITLQLRFELKGNP